MGPKVKVKLTGNAWGLQGSVAEVDITAIRAFSATWDITMEGYEVELIKEEIIAFPPEAPTLKTLRDFLGQEVAEIRFK